MQPRKFRILSAITAGSLAVAVVAITASSGTSQTATPRALAAQTGSFPPVNLDDCPILHTGYPQGGCVAQLQTDLRIVQDPNLDVDGLFGSVHSQTWNAVTAFQGAHGLNPDGMVGPATKKALEAAVPGPTTVPTFTPPPPSTPAPGAPAANPTGTGAALPGSSVPTPVPVPLPPPDRMPPPDRSFDGCPQLKEGVTSPCMLRLRYELVDFDNTYQIPFDQTYGPAMTAAVRNYQSRNQLDVTGEVGPATADLLDFQAGPKTVCIAQGGYFQDNGTCGSDGVTPMGKSLWDCVQELAGKDIAEAIKQADQSAEKAGEVIPRGALREFMEKASAPAEAFKCITFG